MVKLETESLTKVYGDLVAVDDLNVKILDGEFVFFVGPSGCGKTTTLKMLSGLEEPTRGNIILDGKVINKLPSKRRDIGLIFQDYAIFDNMNVYDNIAFSLAVRKSPKEKIDQAVKNIAKQFYLSDQLKKSAAVLTPGELQRVAIARAIIIRYGPFAFTTG